jgi:leucyl-tRNA synthetase
MAEEIFEILRYTQDDGHTAIEFKSIHLESWPSYKEVTDEEATVAVQVNGKMRGTIVVPAEVVADQAQVEKMALADERIGRWISGEYKAIYIPGRILNLVI